VENVKIRIDGKFGEYSNVPLNLYGRILLPFREILKNLGVPDDDKHIIWDGKNRTVTVKKDNHYDSSDNREKHGIGKRKRICTGCCTHYIQ